MSSIADRLKEAIPEDGIREFHRQMQKRNVRGASRAMIHRYLQGETEPPVEFIEAAALVLDKDPAWLAFGLGKPTAEETDAREEVGEHAEAAVTSEDRQRYEALRLKLAILNGMGVVPDVIEAPAIPKKLERAEDFRAWATRVNISYIPPWVPALAEVRARYGRKTIKASAIGQALRGPLEVVGIDPAEGVDHTYRTLEWLDDYIAGMVPVLLALGAERARQQAAGAEEEDTDG